MPSHVPEDIFAEFYIDGAWRSTYDGEDLSARVRGGDSIRINRGGSDQFSSISSQSCNFTLNNHGNFFTDDDPNSPLYRKFGQNTRCKFGIRDASGGLDLYMRFSEGAASPAGEKVYTADKASLDITGDIDIRWEIDLRNTRHVNQFIASKYLISGDQRSWHLWMNTEGGISIRTSPDGLSGSTIVQSSVGGIVPTREGRMAYRLTIDVNNGAGGKVYTWYTASSIGGTWTQVDTATVAGTTSLFSSSAALLIGTSNNGLLSADATGVGGKLYALEIRSGIGGTLVADFNPNQDAELGDTQWVDTCASPNTWIIATADPTTNRTMLPVARIGSDRVRFVGEIQTRPDDWDESGNDRWSPITAQGILSHYNSNRAPLKSVERRFWTRQTDLVVDYWPGEDGSDAVAISSAMDGGLPGIINQVSFGSTEGFGGTTGAFTLETSGTSTALFPVRTYTDTTGAWGFVFYFKLNEPTPLSEQVILNVYPVDSSVHRWVINVGLASYRFQAYSHGGSLLADYGVLMGAGASPENQWIGMGMSMVQEGGDVRWRTRWHAVGTATTYVHLSAGSTFAGTVGRINSLLFNPSDAAFNGVEIAHVVAFKDVYDYNEINGSDFAEVSRGFAGEPAGERAVRLLTEEGVTADWTGALADTERMGPQSADTLYSLLESCARIDGGLVSEARDAISVHYTTGKALGNRKRLELSYTNSELASTPKPTGDSRYTVNDFTMSRSDGGSARYEANDDRRKNVRNPDDASPGIGRFERSDTVNAYEDDQLLDLASFRVHLGTWDERIIPSMAVALHRQQIFSSPALLANVFEQDIGDPVSIVDTLGSPMPPNDVNSVVTGYTETIKNMTHDITFNTVPAGPYQVPIVESDVEEYVPVLDVEGTETTLDGATTSTATLIDFRTLLTATAPQWVDSTNYPDDIGGGVTLDIDINGERVTVTDIDPPTTDATYSYQTFTCIRSVNGVVKSHPDGTVVKLFSPSYLGRI